MPSITARVSDVAARRLLKAASVGSVVELGDFRLIELVGPDLAGLEWHPGDKVRFRVENLSLRTYTPTRWDPQTGSTHVLAYDHGHGPGSTWCAQLGIGDPVQLLAPGRSVRLDQLDAAPILVGDETSFGLAQAWRHHRPDLSPAAERYEVTSSSQCAPVADLVGIDATALVERVDGEAPDLADQVVDLVRANPRSPLCLTGRAQTIAGLRRRLKDGGLGSGQTLVKAYWDVNRKGLD
jgi:NADPH-dependent ferric siderophore reductase